VFVLHNEEKKSGGAAAPKLAKSIGGGLARTLSLHNVTSQLE